MKILHTYCLNYNIGDYALGIGLKNLLRKYLDVSLIGETNIQGRVFDEYYIKEVVNKKYDLLVIGGGGIIHGAHWPNGWFWLIDQEFIKMIKIPFIVYSVGNNYWKEEGKIPKRAVKHLDETIERAAYFSVRNDGSFDRLRGQIKNHHKVNSAPDPGFHVDICGDYQRVIKEPYVMIQLANDKPEIRFGNTQQQNNFIIDMKKVVENLSKRYKVIFSPHVDSDVELSEKIAQGIKNTEVWDFGYFAFDHTKEAIGYYKHANFVLSMRGHGQIVPICFNTPVITIGNHPKHKGLLEELKLTDYYVDLSEEKFVTKINSIVEYLEAKYVQVVNRYKIINKNLQLESENAFEKIKKSI